MDEYLSLTRAGPPANSNHWLCLLSPPSSSANSIIIKWKAVQKLYGIFRSRFHHWKETELTSNSMHFIGTPEMRYTESVELYICWICVQNHREEYLHAVDNASASRHIMARSTGKHTRRFNINPAIQVESCHVLIGRTLLNREILHTYYSLWVWACVPRLPLAMRDKCPMSLSNVLDSNWIIHHFTWLHRRSRDKIKNYDWKFATSKRRC